jgi:hypothetical protein
MLPLDRLRSSFAAGLSMGMLIRHNMKQACQHLHLRLASHGPGAIGRCHWSLCPQDACGGDRGGESTSLPYEGYCLPSIAIGMSMPSICALHKGSDAFKQAPYAVWIAKHRVMLWVSSPVA